MANFEVDNALSSMINQIEAFANSEEVYEKMISEGQQIMQSSIQAEAKRHIRTGQMANSITSTKPYKNKNGEWVGRVIFKGTDGTHTTKSGKKYDITNWLKAFRIEYGTSNQKAAPFVRPAVLNCASKIENKWNDIIEKELKKIQ